MWGRNRVSVCACAHHMQARTVGPEAARKQFLQVCSHCMLSSFHSITLGHTFAYVAFMPFTEELNSYYRIMHVYVCMGLLSSPAVRIGHKRTHLAFMLFTELLLPRYACICCVCMGLQSWARSYKCLLSSSTLLPGHACICCVWMGVVGCYHARCHTWLYCRPKMSSGY